MNWPLFLWAVMTALVVGTAIGRIGEIPKCTMEPYDWMLPVSMFLFMAVNFYYGYLAGKQD